MSKETNTTIGGSASTLLGITFIVLKLTNVINWSWWWVLSPFWIPLSIAILILIGIIVFYRWFEK